MKKNKTPKIDITPEERINRQIHFSVRKELKVEPSTLPNTHETDEQISKYVLDFQLGLERNLDVPIPMSKTGYVYLASLQKRK